jgi:hypothetical protein
MKWLCWLPVFFCLPELGTCICVPGRTFDNFPPQSNAHRANVECLKIRNVKHSYEAGHEPVGTDIASLMEEGGYEHLKGAVDGILDKAEDDPPLMFGWVAIDDFVRSIPTVAGGPAPPFVLPVPLTVENFKAAILSHVRAIGAPQRLDTFLLPCSPAQFGTSCGRATQLCYDPWFKAVIDSAPIDCRVTPLAQLWAPKPRTSTAEQVILDVHAPAVSLWG